MAVAQQELRSDNASRKTGRRTKNGRRKGASRVETALEDGAERLRQAADRRVSRNSEKLADLLTNKALAGDLASAKALFGLAAGKKPIPEPVKKRRGPSYAQRLAAEPKWREAED
jgi:hypothetical protein